jgi:hypothetical protein
MINTDGRSPAVEDRMDFLRNIQPRDWMIAAVSFVVGAIIF